MHLLAYNLLRNLMWTSAELAQVPPMRISLQGTRQLLNHHTHLGGSDYHGASASLPHTLNVLCHKLVLLARFWLNPE